MNTQKVLNKKFYFIAILFFIFLSYNFYSSLYYILDNRDEIRYLSDRLLLLEGDRPSFAHSPQGISLWFGTVILIIKFFLSFIINFDFSNINLFNVLNYYDFEIYKNYQDLTDIKFINFIFVLFALGYLFYQDKIFFYFFSSIFFSVLLYYISYAGKPYLLASIFFSIALIMKKNDRKNFSLIFFSLACAERLEFLLFINYICFRGFNKKTLKDYTIVVIIFMALSPWFSQAILQHIKALSGYLFSFGSNKDVIINDNYDFFFKVLKIISFLLIIFFTLCFNSSLNKKIEKVFIILILCCLSVAMVLNSNIPFRWFLPQLVFIIYYFYLRLNIKNFFINLIIIINFINLVLFQIQLKNITSDKYILELENMSDKNIIGLDLLVEDSNFDNYRLWQIQNIEKPNSKNVNFFNKTNSPLIFGRSGNYEYFFSRRTEYLVKYHNKNTKKKYIYGYSGLFLNYKEWCSLLNYEAYYLINQNFDFKKKRETSLNKCSD